MVCCIQLLLLACQLAPPYGGVKYCRVENCSLLNAALLGDVCHSIYSHCCRSCDQLRKQRVYLLWHTSASSVASSHCNPSKTAHIGCGTRQRDVAHDNIEAATAASKVSHMRNSVVLCQVAAAVAAAASKQGGRAHLQNPALLRSVTTPQFQHLKQEPTRLPTAIPKSISCPPVKSCAVATMLPGVPAQNGPTHSSSAHATASHPMYSWTIVQQHCSSSVEPNHALLHSATLYAAALITNICIQLNYPLQKPSKHVPTCEVLRCCYHASRSASTERSNALLICPCHHRTQRRSS
jgi:hypothetical protein